MSYKVGLDIIEIDRIKKACLYYGNTFWKKILTENEIDYCQSLANPYPSFAVRFAGKEAFSKAVGTGIAKDITWHSLEILPSKHQQPHIHLCRPIRNIQEKHISLSLSHTKKLASAVVVLKP